MGKKYLLFMTGLYLYSSSVLALSIGTYNVWHGLNGQGKISIGELETPDKREAREKNQNEYLANIIVDDIDITFLQEVNPIYDRSEKWSELTGKDTVLGVDNCGVRLLSIGIPTNLYSGLAIVANPEYKLEKIATHELSGGGLVIPPLLCAHFSERRVALFAKVIIPNYGEVLLVNTHLHHKHGLTPYYMNILEEELADGNINGKEYSDLINRAKAATERRKSELNKLIQYIKKYKSEFSIDKVIVAGDFNMDIYRNGENLQHFTKETGLLSPLNFLNQKYYSWWPEKNSNKSYMLDFISDELENDADITEGMRTVLLDEEERPRLIDLMYVSEGFIKGQAPLFVPIGSEKGPDGRHFSDHFGYYFILN